MNSSVQQQTAAVLHEEELKQKLELFRSASKPQKSILKPSGNMPVAPAASKKDNFTRPDGKALLAQPITPKFKAPHSTALKSCGRCTQPSTVAAESRSHLETILQKVLTTANSLANTGNLLEVMLKSAPAIRNSHSLQAVQAVDNVINSNLRDEVQSAIIVVQISGKLDVE